MFAIADLPFALMFIAIIYWIAGPNVALVPLIIFPLSILLAFLFGRAIRRQSQAAMVTSFQKNGLLVEAFDAAETLKASHGRWHFAAKWSALVDAVLDQEDGVKTWSAYATALFTVLSQTSYVLIVCVGAIAAAENEITIGALIACSILSGRINGPLIGQLPSLIVQASYARSSLNLLDGLLELPVEREGARAVRADSLDGQLELEYCRFAYPGGAPVLDIEQLKIAPGETVALIGGIGSGKTTLLRLLAGLYTPTQGAARIGGLDMGQVSDDQLRRHIGYMPQDYRLVNGTLRENLVLGLPDPGDEAIAEAARKTGLIHMIGDHPMGLERPISEGGRGLSGGQRNLTGLTRLMLMQPKVWLLDEPTANLDATTETRVLQALQSGMGPDQSLVMVTHKMALLSMVKRVVVMAKGKVWMDGTPRDVMNELKEQAQAQKAIPKPPGRITAS
jgi:ATP-binding cassette subfamily C protein LapB